MRREAERVRTKLRNFRLQGAFLSHVIGSRRQTRNKRAESWYTVRAVKKLQLYTRHAT